MNLSINRRALSAIVPLVMGTLIVGTEVEAARIKDLSNVRGVRENQLIGYGLVVGLNGTGDGKAEFTSKSFARMLDTIGMKLSNQEIESKNVAAVIITATLPAFARAGNKIDITVNSIGAASSLAGGTLVQSPLRAADQQVYAVAQGSIVSGAPVGGAGGGADKGHPTVARIPNGAMIESDIGEDFSQRKMFRLTLFEPDFTTAARMVKTINQDLGGKFATAKDAATIDVVVPYNYEGNAVEFMASIENLDVSNDTRARVVVNEKTGTIVIGEHVNISTVGISHGNLSVQVKGPASNPDATNSSSTKENKGDRVAVLKKAANVGDLVKALNALGATPKDLITILQTIKAAGALQGELEVL